MTRNLSPGREGLWTRVNRAFIVSVLVLITFIAFESFAITTVLPVAMAELGAQWYSLAYAASIVAAMVGMVIGGNWADRSGPRAPLIVGGTLFLVGMALSALAPDVTTFILARIIKGIGGGIDSVIMYVLIARRISEPQRPRMFGLLSAAWILPSLAGPVVAGALTELTSWRTVFLLVLAGSAVALASLLLSTRGLTPHERTDKRIVGRTGALAVVAALVLLALHLGGQLDGPLSAIVTVAAIVALLATARGILPTGTLLLRGAPQRFVVLRGLLSATSATANLYLTLFLQAERGYPPTTAGLVIAASAGGWALASWVQGRFGSEHRTHSRLILAGTVLVAAGTAVVFSYAILELPLWAAVAACLVMGFGMGIAYPRLSSATLSLADSSEQGSFSSALQVGESMTLGAATALTALAFTTAFSASASFTLVYGMVLSIACLAVAIAVFSRPHAGHKP